MPQESIHEVVGSPHTRHSLAERRRRFLEIAGAVIRELLPFDVAPQWLQRIQLWRIPRRPFDAEPLALTPQPAAHLSTRVGGELAQSHTRMAVRPRRCRRSAFRKPMRLSVVGARGCHYIMRDSVSRLGIILSAPSAPSSPSRFARDAVALMGAQGLITLAAIGTSIITSRALGAEGRGQFSLARVSPDDLSVL